MAVKTLSQVVKSLNSVYSPQVGLLRQQQTDIPTQIADEEKGLAAKQEQSFGEILNGARRRGLGFAGIPLGEQAKYNATEYMPALARLRQTGRQQAMDLEQAILGVRERQTGMASQLREGMLSRDMALRQMREQRRQFDLNLAEQRRQASAARAAAAGASFSPTIGGGSAPKAPVMKRKADGGYAFKDPYGNPISAAAYSLGTGIPFRQLLQQMANKGDKGAKQALGFVGDDYGFDPGRIGNNQALFKALTWGLQ